MKTKVEILDSTRDAFLKIQSIKSDCLLIIIDVNLLSSYKDEISKLTNISDKKVLIYKASSGESTKSLVEYEKCVTYFLKGGIHRNAHLVSIGGGATSDFSGFVASTILRGISWSVIPTTLLSMVDASIGGKVGLNIECGKNLIGAFHLPEHVWISTRFLSTLSELEIQSGRGEILKYGFLDESIAAFIKSPDFRYNTLISMCAQYKVSVTEEDFKEGAKRKILNLGHTFGHALEKHYSLAHGNAVFFGMLIIFCIMDDKKSLEQLKEMTRILDFNNLETPWHNRTFPVNELLTFMNKDKKVSKNNSIELIVIKDGLPEIIEMNFSDLQNKIEEHESELQKLVL